MLEIPPNDMSAPSQQQGSRRILKMRVYNGDDDRIAGSVPVWTSEETAKDAVVGNLTEAQDGKTSGNSFRKTLSYTEYPASEAAQSQVFGFGDLVDMVNPCHHVPIVGSIYREVTGDEIRPISKIIGGAIYGGGVGAGSALVDTVVEAETGKDITENIMSIASEGEMPAFSSAPPPPPEIKDTPEVRLNSAVEQLAAYGETPFGEENAVIAFTDLGAGKHIIHERRKVADGRTAGTYITKHIELSSLVPAREPITELSLSPMKKERDP